MAGSLDDYQHALDEMRDKLHDALAGGTANAFVITLLRTTVDLMAEDLRLRPKETVNFYELKSMQEPGTRGPFLWQIASQKRANATLRPYEPTDAEILQKDTEYREALSQRLGTLNVKTHTDGDCETRYFIEENPRMDMVKNEFRIAVQDWMMAHRYDPKFYKTSALVGLATVLEERQDIVIALRAVQEMGAGPSPVPTFKVEVALWQEALAFGAGCLPYVGNAMALVEATEGRDLFCRKLGLAERVLAVVSVILPALPRVVRAGRDLYTASRLARLYGRDAFKWSLALRMGERATLNRGARQTVREAGALVRAGKALSPQKVKDAEKALAILMGKSVVSGRGVVFASASKKATEEALLEALGKLGSGKPTLAELDAPALMRVADAAVTKKGADINLAKGQLLEELKESRTVKLLREQFGAKALGLDAGSHKIEYFPGYLITDSQIRKLTDGLIARRLAASEIQQAWYGTRTPQEIERIQGVLEVWAVDETKAGKASAQGLSYKYDVTESDREALKAVAVKRFENGKLRAAKAGKSFTATLEEIEKEVAQEYKLGELGGQARLTIERLDMLEDGTLPTIFVGDDEYLVRLRSVSKTKIFGVLPKDVPSKGIVKRLTDPVKGGGEGLNFAVLGIDITQKELEDLAKEVLKVAETVK